MNTTESMSKHLDTTATSIEDHIEKKSVAVATSISGWVKTLSDYPELKNIADDLEDLKEALSAKDGKKIVNLMTKIGTETTKAAEGAEGSEATKIKALGKALTVGAKAVSKLV